MDDKSEQKTPSDALREWTSRARADPTPADWMDGCPHAAACRMQWERLEGPFECDGFGWMDDLARLLGCGEDCECAE